MVREWSPEARSISETFRALTRKALAAIQKSGTALIVENKLIPSRIRKADAHDVNASGRQGTGDLHRPALFSGGSEGEEIEEEVLYFWPIFDCAASREIEGRTWSWIALSAANIA